MFTGIVEELGVLKRIHKGADSARLTIQAEKVLQDVKLGDSIAVNGICLTVTEFNNRFFSVDVMAETLRRTNLLDLQPGNFVNLERALRVGDRLGGHIVSGHIDGVGTIIRQQREDIAIITEIEAPPEVMKYILTKGSVAVDGISLTVVNHTDRTFVVSLIPHTAKMTTLGYKKTGDKVNLESDIIGRYVERLLGCHQQESPAVKKTGISLEFLAEQGFL
ncbi:riboflavin synthase subunit alpha [Thermincola ferriacetica]|uniref:Riboflavin synthase n=1 Tax=Thermincola ferriacetica TaxID=281456 RepID=A0A0L6W6B4_9FIRM|nr:riboflavin synthase [Thermincola ferriacetica]KNZ70654.1 riboflavin synthase subunit alpha [Thermincola ferriacetica]